MSKSVDETVFDYFSLLLAEPNEVSEPPIVINEISISADVKESEDVNPPIAVQQAKVEGGFKAAVGQKQATASELPVKPLLKPTDVSVLVTPASKAATTTLDKQALEKLLSSVVPEIKFADVKTASKPKVSKVESTVTKEKLELSRKTAEKIAEKPTAAIIKEQQLSDKDIVSAAPATQTSVTPPVVKPPLAEQLDEEFQVLFFKVAGLTLAVPLISLGGIVQVDHINHIIGRPKWFLGVQQYRESQLNIVNTAAWVMPEKYDEKLAESVNYQYLVVLENSNWGLACESLINAVKIDKSQVNWRGKAGKRPWLAGVVKEQMCGILHVQALIDMLNAGLGCQDPIN